MSLNDIINFLKNKINNSWYYNANIDYGINGKFLNAKIKDNDLIIFWEEEKKQFYCVISYFRDYTLQQLYDIWCEN